MNLKKYYKKHIWVAIAIILLIVFLTVAIEYFEGRILICKCGYVSLWYNNANGPGNSQHLFDWYSFSHVIHGIVFFIILSLLFKKSDKRTLLIIAVILECAWEIMENSPFLIDRYRTATFSLDYYGDSIINSLFDIFSMVIGFFIANKIKKWQSIALIIFLELFTFIFIRDNLTLNVFNLLFPTEFIKNFQAQTPTLPDINIIIFQKIFLGLIS